MASFHDVERLNSFAQSLEIAYTFMNSADILILIVTCSVPDYLPGSSGHLGSFGRAAGMRPFHLYMSFIWDIYFQCAHNSRPLKGI